ncbi:MAG: putative DNA binding domain-containing protein [Deltaproteobacteria bacterium]|jgi:ATP-dependent DNA helicase RecG|nr:putative DNA binding domain-containing protein [Deltaproteobacteria bacterium]
MDIKESLTVELKSCLTPKIKNEIIAFSNTIGGMVYIGIDDNGDVVGISDPEADFDKIINMIRDGIQPDITQYVTAKIEEINGKNIISVKVETGSQQPYYLSGKGITPAGVFVRQGTSSVHASEIAIKKIIGEQEQFHYDSGISSNQNLSFSLAKSVFSGKNIAFNVPQLVTLGLMYFNESYTNLALLLSDQCEHIIRIGIFKKNSETETILNQDFKGSVIQQIKEVELFFEMNNQQLQDNGPNIRDNVREYPVQALEEALINAVIHRDYKSNRDILIKIFDNRIEFISPGTIFGPITVEDILQGFTSHRNKRLLSGLHRLGYIEALGTGMSKINNSYLFSPFKPEIIATQSTFKVTLPNLGFIPTKQNHTHIPSPEDIILKFVHHNGSINREETIKLLGISKDLAEHLLKKMSGFNQITCKGDAPNEIYTSIEND